VLVRIVKDAQRTKKAGSDGTFNEFVEKHAQTEKLKHTHDPNRHDWKTLVKFVESVLGKEEEEERKNENDDEEEDGEIEKEKTKTNATKTTSKEQSFEETISRHANWQKKNKKRQEWKVWHESCEDEKEKYGEERAVEIGEHERRESAIRRELQSISFAHGQLVEDELSTGEVVRGEEREAEDGGD
jgi:hypothetical protein